MKTKILLSTLAFALFFSTSVLAQTFVYNDSISSGMWFQGTNGAEVDNPVIDDVNSSATCAMSATDGTWQQIQFFPTFTPVAGDKLFVSVYNPNGAGPGQIQFEYSSTPGTWQWGDNIEYTEGSLTGWVEYSIDLSAHAGNEINKIILMPSGDNSSASYIDNIYFGVRSVFVSEITFVYNDTIPSGIWFQGTNGAEVDNPIIDDVNSSASCARSATDGNWQQIQFFPTYTPLGGDKIFFSVYNPGGAGPGQVQFEYTSEPGTWQYAADVSYDGLSVDGWVEYSIDLNGHVGNEINKIIIMPAGNNSSAVYLDNIYFGPRSVIETEFSYVYNDSVSSGIWFQGTNGAEVPNPVLDDVNSSANCAMSATDGTWQQIQYFPSYTPSSGDKLFLSVYNPNNAGPGQVQFEYASDPGTWQYGGDITYDEASANGWIEYNIDLSGHAGNEINKIILMPAGNNSAAVYVDNIYFSSNTLLSNPLFESMDDERIFINPNGKVVFDMIQSDTEIFVFDLSGRMMLNETIQGNSSNTALKQKGLYILKVRKGNSIQSKKLIFH